MPNRRFSKRSNYLDEPIVVSGSFIDERNDRKVAGLIRDRVSKVYEQEPSAKKELGEAQKTKQKSKHQEFMLNLSKSGKDLATIQTEWHAYYEKLPAEEKHAVWQEFYESQSLLTGQSPKLAEETDAQKLAEHKQEAAGAQSKQRAKLRDVRSKQEIKEAIKDKVSAGGKLEAKHQLQSLFFGLGIGAVVVFILLFSFFNQIIIAPFIEPSRASADTPIILSQNSVAPTPNPEVIIPKINVEIPVDYNETSTSESVIESDLEDGVVHYPTTVQPGQLGNAAFFGHSSNNIFNSGKYKFAFVLLHTLANGDTFYLTYNDRVYVYKVISHIVVSPSDVSVLGPVSGQTATATLITCDPPGTSINRLIVVGQQISPSPTTDTAPTGTEASITTAPTTLPSDGQTLWSKFTGSKFGKIVITLVVLGSIGYLLYRYKDKLEELLPR
jgi:LPXTG-site transpeptidase (sortase) family protein